MLHYSVGSKTLMEKGYNEQRVVLLENWDSNHFYPLLLNTGVFKGKKNLFCKCASKYKNGCIVSY